MSTADERIRTWLQAAAPTHAPGGLLAASLARSAGLTARPPRSMVLGVPRVWLGIAATLGLVITSIIGLALAGGASRAKVEPSTRPAPTVALSRDFTSFLWSNGYGFQAGREPATGIVDAATVLDRAAERDHASAFGPPAAPLFGTMTCEWPSLCVPLVAGDRPSATPPDPLAVWLVAYPATDAWTLVDAASGAELTGSLGTLGSCTAADVGTNPFCTAGVEPPSDPLPVDVRYALAVWGQEFMIETVVSIDPGDAPTPQGGGLDPATIVASLAVADPRWSAPGPDIQGAMGWMACRRPACPEGVATRAGEPRRVWVIARADASSWVVVDAETGVVIRDDSSAVRP